MKYSIQSIFGVASLGSIALVVACSGGPGTPTYLNTGNREPVTDSREGSATTNTGGTGSTVTTPTPAGGNGNSGSTPGTGNGNGNGTGNGTGNGNGPGSGMADAGSPTTDPDPTTQASCATLEACCSTLPSGSDQCTQLAGSGDEKGCESALKSLQASGYCN